MLARRRFLQSIVAAALTPASAVSSAGAPRVTRALRPDPNRLLDLPAGFELSVVSRAGETMSDGFRVPAAHDGMAAFAGSEGRIVLVCNHEVESAFVDRSAFAADIERLPGTVRDRIYDWGGGVTPGAGGTTTAIYDPASRRTEREYLSLAGTEVNCAGGSTPWGSWLSCEESFSDPGISYRHGRALVRERRHGYVFEVDAGSDGLVDPVPLRDMGRFAHEAAAVDAATGIVYLTEDRFHGLFYRYLPDVPGKLAAGGRLQALSVLDEPAFRTHNWGAKPDLARGRSLPVRWIDLDYVDPVEDDLRLRGAAAGAATFARGEGLCAANGEFVFTCTIGGAARRGQVFAYRPGPCEGCPQETERPGQLRLVAEADTGSLLQNADNLTMAPWGDLIVCEDTASHCGLVGICPDGTQYMLADNAYSGSELAGVCFSPDGKTLFVNIQYPGMTVAIAGPWPA